MLASNEEIAMGLIKVHHFSRGLWWAALKFNYHFRRISILRTPFNHFTWLAKH
jgi:hypothetical protein